MRRLITLVILLSPAMLVAQEARFELTPTIGHMLGGAIRIEDRAFTNNTYDVNVGDSGSYALLFDLPMGRQTWLELTVDRQETALEDNQGLFGEQPGGFIVPGDNRPLDTTVMYYHLGAQWELTSGPNRWFVTASAGVTHFQFALPVGNDTRLSLSGGGGLKVSLNDRLGLRFGGRVYWTDTDDGSARVQRFQHRDCGATCYYVYRYLANFVQTELSVGLTIKL